MKRPIAHKVPSFIEGSENVTAKQAMQEWREWIDYVNFLEKKCEILLNEKHNFSKWVSVGEGLPKPLQTVWLANSQGWVGLGCLVEINGEWHWSQSNGVIYFENGQIIAECESEDLNVEYWHELPNLLIV